MIKLAFVCAEGLEDVVFGEILEYGSAINPEKYKGLLLLDFEGDIKDMKKMRTADDILIFIRKFTGINRYKASLRNIRQQCAKSSLKEELKTLSKYRKTGDSFCVRASYSGRRDYKADEIKEAGMQGLSKANLKPGDDAGLLCRIILSPEISFIGLSLEDKPLDEKKRYLTAPGSLKPSVANSLLRLAGTEKNKTLADPMCGTGVIAIEASAQGLKALAGDIDPEKIEIARKNNAARKAEATFCIWDARKTGLRGNSVDAVVTNLPFGKTIKIEGYSDIFFEEFIQEMVRIGRENAKYVFLTGHSGSLIEVAKSHRLELVAVREIVNSGLRSSIVILKKTTFSH